MEFGIIFDIKSIEITTTMNTPSIQTLTFIFDNETDYILLHQIADEGPLKRKHSGIKTEVGITEDMNQAAIRSMEEASSLDVPEVVLRGVVKVVYAESQTSVIYFVYESSRFSGELENKLNGRLKWVDILNIFNLQLEGVVQEIMPNLLDGESFFEGFIQMGVNDEVVSSDIRVCNTI
jgi:hypothetical protein